MEWRKRRSNHKDYKHFHVVVKTSWEYSPVALAYTTLARGSLFCSCSTALPILVDVAFLALWHSSNTIYKHGAVKGIIIATIQRCVIRIQFSNLHICCSGIVKTQTIPLHQSQVHTNPGSARVGCDAGLLPGSLQSEPSR